MSRYLFVMFFPQLIAGPIVHHSELIPQLQTRLRVSANDLAAGLALFTMGLLKKVILADSLASFCDALFAAANAGHGQSLVDSWTAALGFTFQIYFDFSGYTDMALGLAMMMGIRLPLNFNSPYKALNIIDFWRRWHMTLSRFLRDYVYIPLGGNRHGPSRRYVNVMITMLLGGLWHGAAWTFVLWGGLHGLYLVVNHAWHHMRSRLGLTASTPITCGLSRTTTFLSVVVAWVFFRAPTFDAAHLILNGMVGAYGILTPPTTVFTTMNVTVPFWPGGPLPIAAIVALAVLWIAVWTLPNSQQILSGFQPVRRQPIKDNGIIRTPLAVRRGLVGAEGRLALTASTGFVLAGALLCTMIFQAVRSTTLQQFIYFQF